ncbi:unnamed protein product, partial [Prorocentrum cordatum]
AQVCSSPCASARMLRLVSASSCHTAADLQLDVAQVLLPRAEPTAMRHAVLACVANVIISVGSTILFIREISVWRAPHSSRTSSTPGCRRACAAWPCACFTASAAREAATRCGSRFERGRSWRCSSRCRTCWRSPPSTGSAPRTARSSRCSIRGGAVVPMTLVASSALLGHSYALAHWAAAAVVLAGICLAYLPNCSSLALGTRQAGASGARPCVPQCLANVRCEALLSQWSSSRDGPRLVLQMGFFTALFSVSKPARGPAALRLPRAGPGGPGRRLCRKAAALLVGAAGAGPAWPAAAAFASLAG